MGIGQFFKNLLSSGVKLPLNQPDDIIEKAYNETEPARYWYSLKATEIKVFSEIVLALSDKDKIAFIFEQMQLIDQEGRKFSRTTGEADRRKNHIRQAFVEQLFRHKLALDADDIELLTFAFTNYKVYSTSDIFRWPIKSFVGLIQKKYKEEPIPQQVENSLKKLQDDIVNNQVYNSKNERVKLLEQIEVILFVSDKNDKEVKPVFFLGEDDFAVYANKMIADLAHAEKAHWYKLIAFCQKANGGKPTKKFLDEGLALIKELGAKKFQDMILNWFAFIVKLKEKAEQGRYVITYTFITSVNSECLKGFIWLCSNFNNAELLQSVADLADRAYRKITGVGQTSTVIGNACVFTLYKSNSLEGIGHLSRLKLRSKQTSTQALIQKYMLAAAEERGNSVEDIEDFAVDDFGLANGEKHFELEGYKAVVKIEKSNKINLNWFKIDGTAQKTEPTAIKEKQGDQLKKIKTSVKQIEAALSTQRDRLDFSFKADRKMSWEHFITYYFNHGLASVIAHKLIWRFEKTGHVIDAIYLNGRWANSLNEPVEPDEQYAVSLWHPAIDTLEHVSQWRQVLISNEMQQPIKQAFREIYLLTDAEINTRTYSNRMAGHILKQHQLNSLAKARNWKYALQGGFDGGFDGKAQLFLPEHHLLAEYWTEGVNGENGINSSGIFNYVATDQVRFRSTQTNDTIELVDIPVLVFSEVMRDVDLFVGVASVGNDPNWRDNGGMPAYRDYWQAYAFGELNEVSKNRKEILARLLPRLKIAKIAEIKDKFLVVKGKKRVYKIHLGSTNILMEPNDQYLCIVPDRTPKNITETVFLPFEGDSGLSVIISKAFLLADDDKITDTTIIRQIGR